MDLAGFRDRTDAMVADLATLVAVESPSSDLTATAACAVVLDEVAVPHLGEKAERVVIEGRTHLRWRFGSETRVVLIGHFDTVWPVGTVERWPFSVDGDRATGPGAFDMKGGIVQGLHALASLDSLDGVAVVFTSDEELGSPTSRELIRDTVTGAGAALVLEPSAAGALKTARKGVAHYQVRVTGKAAHAGLDPEKGINAALEMAHQVIAIAALERPDIGTTVTPTLVTAGNSGNTVPEVATLEVDVRVPTVGEDERVAAALRALQPVLDGTTIVIEPTGHVLPLERSSSAELFERAQKVAADLGLPALEEAMVGGGSDGNYTASLGVPTLDGLGAVGDGAHAEGEHVVVSAMPERTALVAALVKTLIGD